jgi:hypothetical protein
MAGFDQFDDMPEGRRAELLGRIRALQAGESLDRPGGAETAAAGDAPGGAGRPAHGRAAWPRRGAAVVLATGLAVGGAVLLARLAGPGARHVAAPRPLPRVLRVGVPPSREAAPAPASSPVRVPPAPSTSVSAAPPVPVTEIAGIGCPDGLGRDVTQNASVIGPGWIGTDGGWTGNGCDGSSEWTVGILGDLTGPSTLTWAFHPATGTSRCTLAVYVPEQDALGEGEYAISGATGVLGNVLVNQAAAVGQWFALGTYRVAGSSMTVQLTPQSGTSATQIDLPALTVPDRVGASAARATCS